MRPQILAVTAAAALALCAGPVAAQTPADRSDTRCLLVLQLVARDPANKEAASRGIFYYLGRLQAHGFAGKLDTLFIPEAKTLNSPQQMQAEAVRCNGELNAHAGDLTAAFKKLQAAIPPPPPRPAAAPPAK